MTKRRYTADPAVYVACVVKGCPPMGGKRVTEAVELHLTPTITVPAVLCSQHQAELREWAGEELTEAWPDAVPEDAVAA